VLVFPQPPLLLREPAVKLLILNANTSVCVTERMVATLRDRCPPGVELTGATAAFGAPYVATRAAAAVAAHAALDAVGTAVEVERAAGRAPFDGCLYACFGEPGLAALRSAHAFPVAGMAEASILAALQLGERFSIVTVGATWPPMLRELMRAHALDGRCAGFGVVEGDALALVADRAQGAALVEAAVAEVLARQGADVVIVGGASLAGYGAEVAGAFTVPVLDSLAAGFEQALALARLRRS